MVSLGVYNLGLVLLQPFSNGCRVIVLLRNGYCITFYSKSPSSNPDLGCCVVFLGKLLMVVWYEQRRTTHWTNQKSKQSTQALSTAENVRHFVSIMRVESTRLKKCFNFIADDTWKWRLACWRRPGSLGTNQMEWWTRQLPKNSEWTSCRIQTTKCRRRICFPTP